MYIDDINDDTNEKEQETLIERIKIYGQNTEMCHADNKR